MTVTGQVRSLPGDWYAGVIPANVEVDPTAFLETAHSFRLYRSGLPVGMRIGRGASTYRAMFDVGPRGQVDIGDYVLVNEAWFICDAEITVGAYTLISWNVVLMDTYRVPLAPAARRYEMERIPKCVPRRPDGGTEARPIRIHRNVWVGFDVCILPGVTVGEGAIVGARSVVASDVPPYSVVAGNPARVIRHLTV